MNELENAENGPTLDADSVSDLIKIQTSLVAPKNLHNKFGGFNYRNCESILQAVKPYLEELGCSLTMKDKIVVLGDGGAGTLIPPQGSGDPTTVVYNNRFYVKATATFTDSNGVKTKVSAFAREEQKKKGMDSAQLTGSTSSYARKYALSGLFLLDDNKDGDSIDGISDEEAKTFAEMVENKEGAKLFMIKNEDPERFKEVMNKAAPSTGKTKFKNDVGSLTFDAYAQAKKAADAIRELLPKGDAFGVKEIFEEMDHDETRILWMQFSEEQRTDIKNLKGKI